MQGEGGRAGEGAGEIAGGRGEHKTSKPGKLVLTYSGKKGEEYTTKPNATAGNINAKTNELDIVYDNGMRGDPETLDSIHRYLKERADTPTITLASRAKSIPRVELSGLEELPGYASGGRRRKTQKKHHKKNRKSRGRR
jgi:hypothetical protein